MTDEELLGFIRDHVDEHGYPPSNREIAAQFGMWPNAVQYRLRKMVEAGLIRATPGIARSVNITGAGMKMITERL